MDKLSAEIFFNQEIPGPIRTANIEIGNFQGPTKLREDHTLVLCLYEKWPTRLKRANKTAATVLEPLGPSMYTLSIALDIPEDGEASAVDL